MLKQVVHVVTIAFEGLEFDAVINQYLCVVKRELTVAALFLTAQSPCYSAMIPKIHRTC
jgi:hypothetical protein